MGSDHPLDRLRPGMRAVVRHRTGTGMSDALGRIEALDAESVELETRSGRMVVQRRDVVLAKEVPPPPARRGAPHRALSDDDLERVMVDGWPPLERAQLGGWLLRASRGYTRRANSLLALGDPGMPPAKALDHAQRWYAERGLPLLVAVHGQEALEQELLARGHRVAARTLAMTASVATVIAAAAGPADAAGADGGEPTVDVSPEPSAAWLRAAAATRTTDPEVLRRIVTGSPEQVFAEVRGEDGAPVAIARAPFAHVWAGLTNVHVQLPARRRGVATLVTGALAREAHTRGIRSMWLQVEAANSAARAAYERLGFTVHHEYRYLAR